MVKVTVKWGKTVLEDVNLDTAGTGLAFKELLYTLTGVPVARQKVMGKKGWKGVLKDEHSFAGSEIAEGSMIMLMGSSTGIPKPETKTVFIEDMTVADAAAAGAILPTGIVNIGNTCYMNSTLECFRHMPELRDALNGPLDSSGAGAGAGAGASGLASPLKQLFDSLDRSEDAVQPIVFWTNLAAMNPMFAERGRGGGLQQQDSEEFQSSLLTSLASSLRTPTSTIPSLVNGNFIDALLGLEMETTLSCPESEAEADSVKSESQRKLVCNIEGGAGKVTQINTIREGVELGLTGQLEKHASTLSRNAVFNKSSRISRLPRVLCVQFLRFYWKATPDSRDHTGVKCKMLRPVSFDTKFDVYDFCTDAVKAKLKVFRDKAMAEADAKATAAIEGKTMDEPAAAPAAAAPVDDVAVDDDELAAALAMSMGGEAAGAGAGASAGGADSSPPGIGLPDEFQGIYELFAVVTHKGRSADSGHYMGWVRNSEDEWYCFDDDDVSPCTTADILALKGGGDHHMASMVFYRAKK